MIKIELTPNYTGVKISGSRDDLIQVVDAIYALVIDELYESSEYHTVSNRILGLCYEIRHASMGDREVQVASEELPVFSEDGNVIPMTYKILTYGCYCLFPEMCFVMMAINRVINYRINSLTTRTYDTVRDPKVIWDEPIAVMRQLQAAFITCMRNELTRNTLTRFRKYLVEGEYSITRMYHHYLDDMNLEFLTYTPQKREKSLSVTAKHLSEFLFDEEYLLLKREIDEAAKHMNTDPVNLKFPEQEYPEEIVW